MKQSACTSMQAQQKPLIFTLLNRQLNIFTSFLIGGISKAPDHREGALTSWGSKASALYTPPAKCELVATLDTASEQEAVFLV